MADHIHLASALLEATIALQGAELQSLVHRPTGRQMLWQGDAQHWGKRSPLLFPQIGRCWQDTLRHEGRAYTMPKHGVMIEYLFSVAEQTAERVTLVADTGAFGEVFPHHLRIAVCYTIANDTLRCTYTVTHADGSAAEVPAYYQVGGHPGFNLPAFDATYPTPQGYIALCDEEGLPMDTATYHLPGEGGCMDVQKPYAVKADAVTGTATFGIEAHTFDSDALVFDVEGGLTATLYDSHRHALLRFGSNAPVLAFWSPLGGKAPFVCFEPWWGSPDSIGYVGEASGRRFAQCLPPYGRNTHLWYVRILPVNE